MAREDLARAADLRARLPIPLLSSSSNTSSTAGSMMSGLLGAGTGTKAGLDFGGWDLREVVGGGLVDAGKGVMGGIEGRGVVVGRGEGELVARLGGLNGDTSGAKGGGRMSYSSSSGRERPLPEMREALGG